MFATRYACDRLEWARFSGHSRAAWLSILLVFLHGCREEQGSGVDPLPNGNWHLFLLVGQSNMSGRGLVEDSDRVVHPRVWMLDKGGKWVPAKDPLHFDKPQHAGVGLGRTFALEYAAAYPEVHVGLIPCAVGGSPISAWEPGGRHAGTGLLPWDDAIARAKLALEQRALPGGIPGGGAPGDEIQAERTLKGILWHQGESDSKPKLAPAYPDKLRSLVIRFRNELDAPTVPFMIGQLGQFSEKPWSASKQRVDQAHRALPDQLPQVAFVSSAGLTHKGDNLHFGAEAMREMGTRYFAAYQRLVPQADLPESTQE